MGKAKIHSCFIWGASSFGLCKTSRRARKRQHQNHNNVADWRLYHGRLFEIRKFGLQERTLPHNRLGTGFSALSIGRKPTTTLTAFAGRQRNRRRSCTWWTQHTHLLPGRTVAAGLRSTSTRRFCADAVRA